MFETDMTMGDIFWNIFFFICGITATLGANEAVSPDNVFVIPLSVYPCEDSEPAVQLDLNLHDISDEDKKALDAEFDLNKQFSERNPLLIKVDYWENGAWDKSDSDFHGQTCQILDRYISTAWRKLRKSFSPAMSEHCLIKPGHYKLTNFKVSTEDYNFPVTNLGKYRITARVLDELNSELFCHMAEFELAEKS